jgi:hypothetical protein
MRRDRIVHLLLLALGVAACRDQPPAAELGPASDPEPVLTETTRHVELRDMAGTGVTGELIVTPFPDSVMFHLSINDAAANSTLGARVQTGSCESPGPVVELLASVLTGALGNGRSQRSIYDDRTGYWMALTSRPSTRRAPTRRGTGPSPAPRYRRRRSGCLGNMRASHGGSSSGSGQLRPNRLTDVAFTSAPGTNAARTGRPHCRPARLFIARRRTAGAARRSRRMD